MIGLLIQVLIILLVAGFVVYIIGLIPLPHPFQPIAQAVVALIVLLILIDLLLGLGGIWHPALR